MQQQYAVKPYGHSGYSWVVESWVTGKRKRKFFRSRRDANTYAQLKNIEILNSGLNAVSVSDEMRVEVQRAMLLLQPYGKTILEAVQTALPLYRAEMASRTVADAVGILLKTKQEEGASDRYLADLRSRLGRFVSAFGDRLLPVIGTGEIKEWLRSLPGNSTTKNNMRRLISVLYSFAIEMEWCEQNIVARVRPFQRGNTAIGILSPAQARSLLDNAHPRLKPLLAIGLFAGLRRSELLRVSVDRGGRESVASSWRD